MRQLAFAGAFKCFRLSRNKGWIKKSKNMKDKIFTATPKRFETQHQK